MKKHSTYRFLIFFAFLLALISCKPEDNYFSLSNEAKEFLVYEEGETFKLRNENTQEVILFTIISKTIEFEEDGPNSSPPIAFGLPVDNYYEKGTVSFSSMENYNGEISVMADRNEEYDFRIYFKGAFEYNLFSYPTYFGAININDIEYQDSYILKSYPNELYYSKEKGILKIYDVYEEITKFSIVE